MFQENDVTQQEGSSQCVCTLRQRSTVQFTADVGWYDFDTGQASDDTSFFSISTNTLQYISIRALTESSVEVEGRFNELTFDNSSSTMRVSIHIKPVIFPGILGGEISLQCINPLSPLQTTTTTTTTAVNQLTTDTDNSPTIPHVVGVPTITVPSFEDKTTSRHTARLTSTANNGHESSTATQPPGMQEGNSENEHEKIIYSESENLEAVFVKFSSVVVALLFVLNALVVFGLSFLVKTCRRHGRKRKHQGNPSVEKIIERTCKSCETITISTDSPWMMY